MLPLFLFIQMLGITKKSEIIIRSRPSMIQLTYHWNKKIALDRKCVCIIYCSLIFSFSVEELQHAGVGHHLFFFYTAYVSGTSWQVSPFLSAELQERGSLTWPTEQSLGHWLLCRDKALLLASVEKQVSEARGISAYLAILTCLTLFLFVRNLDFTT